MNKKRMRFLRIVAGVMVAVIMVCSMQSMVGIAAEEITDSDTVEETQEETMSAESDSVSDEQEAASEETALKVVSCPEYFMDYLDVQARMERYSVANTLLIYCQYPEAVQLKEYDEWIKAGIYPKRNVQKINILEPVEYVKPDGTLGRGSNVKRMYDVSQTNCRNPPARVSRDPKQVSVAMLNSSPIRVKVIDQFADPDLKGYYDHENGEIRIKRGLESSEQVFQVAALEVAHAELALGAEHYSREDKSFQAVCIAYMLCEKYGIDTGNLVISQLPEQFGTMEAAEVRNALTEIRSAMVDISDRISKELYRSLKARERESDRDR